VSDLLDLKAWTAANLAERRQALADALREEFTGEHAVQDVSIELGPIGREYDLTAAIDTDVGRLRTPLWSHARATIYGDPSIHPANRQQLAPELAIAEAAARLRRRLAVPYRLESKGLTFSVEPEEGVERTWTAEHSRFRKRTAVSREDTVRKAGDLDVRDLLAHFYTGPALRLVSDDGEPFLLPAAPDVEGPLVTLCQTCRIWTNGAHESCSACGGGVVDVVVAARLPRR
jgi:hypothetical protein